MLIDGPVQGQAAIMRYLLDRPAPTPPDVHAKLEELAMPSVTPSPVVGCLEAAELIYARRDDLAPELLGLGADLAEMAARHRYQMGEGPIGEAGRALGISAVLRSMDGVVDDEGATLPATAPAPKAEYVPPPEETPPDPPEAP